MADTDPDPTDATDATDPTTSEPDAVVLDAKGLRAMAHPVRVQLVGLLRRHGPSTATLLAERMGLTSGATSYHLRQLGAAGFVAEDTERGNARERWWRAVHEITSLDDIDLVEREPEAALAYMQSVTAVYTMRTQRALGEFQTMPRPWQEVLDITDWSLLLTPQEARSLGEELHALVSRYRRDSAEGAAQAPAGAERVSLIAHLLPEPQTEQPETEQ
ncbi:DNA-binding transcriptional ArsR family regulator [Kitasatospora sp. MAA4]|uniref:helix-turn-helix domain-containing protein n=1 Tax=Kitasatospora sp. MAA4 TaxID=3035093 RepID=UPI0024731941|nr:helix-turn-helix domain-containing protein [Kitasatospora sp. MAA4]MDH6132188.1 DNA-binding transcriptional ArsR family regulator [Kitasatospora sp. MAA4]